MKTITTTTAPAAATVLPELRRQLAEARKARAYWAGQYLRTARGYNNSWRCADPTATHNSAYWAGECARLRYEIDTLAPNHLQDLLYAAKKPLGFVAVGFALAGCALAFPALLVAAAVVCVAYLPWMLIAKLPRR